MQHPTVLTAGNSHAPAPQLRLGRNLLDGEVPQDWLLPSTLRVLDLTGNQFSGSLPTALALPESLEVFSLGANQFSGRWVASPAPSCAACCVAGRALQ